MEYRIEKLLEGLQSQRESLIDCLTDLNENLPNYSIKVIELNNQIINIDNQVRDFVYSLKDLETIKMNNDLQIKTQGK